MDCLINTLKLFTTQNNIAFADYHNYSIDLLKFNNSRVKKDTIILLSPKSSINKIQDSDIDIKIPFIDGRDYQVGNRNDVFNKLNEIRNECNFSKAKLSIVVYGKEHTNLFDTLKTNNSYVIVYFEHVKLSNKENYFNLDEL